MEDLYKKLYDYFAKEISEGKIDFSLRAKKTDRGIEFYVHPNGKDGQTIDLVIAKEQHTSFYLTSK